MDLNGILCINGAHDIVEVAYLVVSLGDSGGNVIPTRKWQAHLNDRYPTCKTLGISLC